MSTGTLSPEEIDNQEQSIESSDDSSISGRQKNDELSALQGSWDAKFEDKNTGEGKKKFWTKRKQIAGGAAGILGTGTFVALTLLTNFLELPHLSASLDNNDRPLTKAISSRVGRMLYRSMAEGADDRLLHSRSRLGAVQNRTFGNIMNRLEDQHGVRFSESTGSRTGLPRVDIDIDEPPPGSALSDSTPTKTRLQIARSFGVNPAQVVPNTVGTSSGWRITGIELNSTTTDNLMRNMSDLAGGGRFTQNFPTVAKTLNTRLFRKVFRLPSLFHPVSRTAEAAARRVDNSTFLNNRRERRKAQKERATESSKTKQRITDARSEISSKISGSRLAIGVGASALSLQGVLCAIDDLAGILPGVFYATVVMPSIINVLELQAVAGQGMSGQDVDLQGYADLKADLRDDNGGSVWQAKSLDSLVSGGAGEGTDIDQHAKIAFVTQGSSISGLYSTVSGQDLYDEDVTNDEGESLVDSVSGWACSTPVRFAGLVAGIGLTAASFAGCGLTGGTSCAATGTRIATQAALGMAVFGAVSKITGNFVEDEAEGRVADACGIETNPEAEDGGDKVTIIDAKKYGNCLAYGKRMSTNIVSASMGGTPVDSQTEQALLNEINQQEIAELRQKNLTERLFSLSEKRSFASTFLQPVAQGEIHINNVGSLFTGLIGSFGGLGSSFSRSVTAQSEGTYNWGFPLVVPTEERYPDFLENAAWVADHEDEMPEERIKHCFGVELTGSGETFRSVPLNDEINPLSDNYKDANCDDKSDEAFARVSEFITYDSIARVISCLQEDDETACNEIGFGGGASQSPPSSLPGGDITINGHVLSENQEKWFRYIHAEILPNLTGTDADKINKAAQVTWWALKEGTMSLDSPLSYSLCHFSSGDAVIGVTEVCSNDIWAVGLAGVQPNNLASAAANTASAIYDDESHEDILERAAAAAGLSEQDVQTVRNSSGELKTSWLMRDGPIAFEWQGSGPINPCFEGSPPGWCFSTGWDTSRMFAPDRATARNVIDEIEALFR